MNDFMVDPQKNDIRPPGAVGKPSSEEITQMQRIVLALNMIRMSFGMYPPGHAKITESIDSAIAVIQKGFKNRSELTFNVTGGTLLFWETVLDEKNAAVRDYIRALSNLRILSFSLHRGLKKKDLTEFSRILTSKPADIWAQGKIDGILLRAGATGIKVKEADAEIYNLTGDKRKIAPDQARKKREGEAFWQDFISRLKKSDHLDSEEAMRVLNEQRQHWQVAGQTYEGMIKDYFQEIREGREIRAEHLENLAKVSSVIKELHPDLKRQFLEVVERQISLQSEKSLTAENLKCFPSDVFLEIVGRANEAKSQISPALVMILQKMSHSEKDKTTGNETGGEDISFEEMGKLFKREQHENYVPTEYSQTLKRAAQTADRVEPDEERFPIQEYLKTITEDQIRLRIGQLLLAMMDGDAAEEVYLVCATGLTHVVPGLIQSGQVDFLTDLVETLRRHGREGGNPSEKIRQAAMSGLQPFSDPKYMEKQIAPFIQRGLADTTGGLTKFLMACGSQNVPWLFDLYLDPLAAESTAPADILKGFGSSAVDEAVKRLAGQAPQGIVRLLTFLRAADDPSVVAFLKNLTGHEDWNVRREVIETLLYYKDSAAVPILRKCLGSKNHEERLHAVSLACRYRVTVLIGDLMSLLKTFVIREEDTLLNDWIIRQMGATGDPAFAPCLDKISRIRLSLTPKQLSRMKLILYGSLVHFPRESVRGILERGTRSYNRKIRVHCTKMLER